METFAALNIELTTSSQFPTTDLRSKKTKWPHRYLCEPLLVLVIMVLWLQNGYYRDLNTRD